MPDLTSHVPPNDSGRMLIATVVKYVRNQILQAAFPQAAFLRLATAVVIEAHDEWQVTHHYVSDVSMDELRVVIAAKERAASPHATPESLTPELENA